MCVEATESAVLFQQPEHLTPVAPKSTEFLTGSCCGYRPVSVKERSVQKGSGPQTRVHAPVPIANRATTPVTKRHRRRAAVGLPSLRPGAPTLWPTESPED